MASWLRNYKKLTRLGRGRYVLEVFVRIIFFIISFLPLLAYSKPSVDVIEKYYKVEAQNKTGLPSAINAASPIRENGEIFHAYTDTYVNWKYWWVSKEKYCKISRVETSVKITYTLPMLSSNTKDNGLIQIWNKYYPALLKHENGHANIAIKAADKIESTLMSLPAGSSCEKVGEYADLQARKILESLPEKHRSYDRETDHGKTQGAYIWLYL